MAYTKRFEQALCYAHQLHRTQKRKGSGAPYITHLMGVASLVGEYGGDEDQVVAALLHDAIEDQGGAETGAVIRERFGERVARMVEDCSDCEGAPKPPWRQRKEAYLVHLESVPADTLLVSIADKVYNARAILMDVRAFGPGVWSRFRGGKEGTLWYYQNLVTIFQNRYNSPLTDELNRTVLALRNLVQKKEAGLNMQAPNTRT